jgi:hypothetical protein
MRLMRDIPYPGDPRGKGTQGGRSPVVIGYPAIVTSAISQASGTTFGSGQVQLYYPATPDATLLTADADSTTMPVNNWFTTSGTIAAGKHCMVISFGGSLWLLTWEC